MRFAALDGMATIRANERLSHIGTCIQIKVTAPGAGVVFDILVGRVGATRQASLTQSTRWTAQCPARQIYDNLYRSAAETWQQSSSATLRSFECGHDPVGRLIELALAHWSPLPEAGPVPAGFSYRRYFRGSGGDRLAGMQAVLVTSGLFLFTVWTA